MSTKEETDALIGEAMLEKIRAETNKLDCEAAMFEVRRETFEAERDTLIALTKKHEKQVERSDREMGEWFPKLMGRTDVEVELIVEKVISRKITNQRDVELYDRLKERKTTT